MILYWSRGKLMSVNTQRFFKGSQLTSLHLMGSLLIGHMKLDTLFSLLWTSAITVPGQAMIVEQIC